MASSTLSNVMLSQCCSMLVDRSLSRLRGNGNIGTLGKSYQVTAKSGSDQSLQSMEPVSQ